MKKTDRTETLSLRRETLKELSVEDLRHVAQGTPLSALGTQLH